MSFTRSGRCGVIYRVSIRKLLYIIKSERRATGARSGILSVGFFLPFIAEDLMSVDLGTLFDDFDRGRLSRRDLFKALGIAVALRPAAALAQGQCGGARAGTPECDPTPAKLPFEPTGWKTVLLDHFSCQVV